MSSTKRRLSGPAVLYTARSIRSSPDGKTYGQLLLEEQVQQRARQKEQEALWALRVEHSAKQEKAVSDFTDLKGRIESRSAATAAGKPVYGGKYDPIYYKRRRFTKRHATSRYTGKVRSRKHGDVNILLETCYSDALHVYKLLCRQLRNFNEKDSKSSLSYNRLLTKLREKSEKIYLKLKKHKKATASDFVILSKIKRLEIKYGGWLNILHAMLDNKDIKHAIPVATKLFRNNMRDDIAEKFFNYLRLNAYREYPEKVKGWFKTLCEKSMTEKQQKMYDKIIGYIPRPSINLPQWMKPHNEEF
jgi:hypothetical protein